MRNLNYILNANFKLQLHIELKGMKKEKKKNE